MLAGLTLVVPAKPDAERDAVARAWEADGGAVVRLDRFWEPPPLEPAAVRLYGPDTFCLVAAQKLGVRLISPADELLAEVPAPALKRRLVIQPLAEALAGGFACFVKPATPKLFRAGVYASAAALAEECRGLDPATRVIVSEAVRFDTEVRSFVLGGEVLTRALYEGEGDVDGATGLLDEVARAVALPPTCVLDVGHIAGRGWALIEANASWGAGLNGCDPRQVIRCLAVATRVAAA